MAKRDLGLHFGYSFAYLISGKIQFVPDGFLYPFTALNGELERLVNVVEYAGIH